MFFIGKNIGKSAPPKEIVEPDDIKDPTNPTFSPTAITNELYNTVKGVSLFDNTDVYKKLSILSDNNLAKVLNDWDDRYFAKWNETFFEVFSKEKFMPWNKSMMNALYKRIKKLETLRK